MATMSYPERPDVCREGNFPTNDSLTFVIHALIHDLMNHYLNLTCTYIINFTPPDYYLYLGLGIS